MSSTAITIQARMRSTRLPGKVLAEAVGKPMLELMIERLRRVRLADYIVVATTIHPTDDPIVALAERLGVGHYRGSEEDVLSRVLEAARTHKIDVIVETTGDCPLIDPDVIDQTIQLYRDANVDYTSNILERTYPIGMDVQVFSADALADVARRTNDPSDHEHVSTYIYHHPEIYRLRGLTAPPPFAHPDWRLTLDTPDDLALIREVFRTLYPKNPTFSLADIAALFEQRPELPSMNAHIQHRWVHPRA